MEHWHITAVEMCALHINVLRCIALAAGRHAHIMAWVDNKACETQQYQVTIVTLV